MSIHQDREGPPTRHGGGPARCRVTLVILERGKVLQSYLHEIVKDFGTLVILVNIGDPLDSLGEKCVRISTTGDGVVEHRLTSVPWDGEARSRYDEGPQYGDESGLDP